MRASFDKERGEHLVLQGTVLTERSESYVLYVRPVSQPGDWCFRAQPK